MTSGDKADKPNRWSDAPAPRQERDGSITPAGGVTYVGVLRESDLTDSITKLSVGLVLSMIWYSVVVPILAAGIIGIGWLGRGRPGPFKEFQERALKYEYIEGLIGTHLGIATLIIGMALIVYYVHHRHPKWLASVQPGIRWRYLFGCVLIAVVSLNVVYWVSRLGHPLEVKMQPGAWLWLAVILLTSPLQAAGEEFLFRGYLMQTLGASGLKPIVTLLLSAGMFALLHGTQNLPLFVDRFGFGLLAGGLVIMTGGLEAAIAAHAVNNVFSFSYATVEGGLAAMRAISESTWATTGWDLLAYGATFFLCWLLSNRMKVSTLTPAHD